ncbi:hypothetical protein [Sphingomonas montanisoli]|uniref:Uncharacterized protein n=1 Tax=Sphingomonas montanisoli TaxID=2606412 RepID=A0A5D9C3K9_9SPHN|nr:hypothetical protein [Sphingomonas montanisoli]TZG25877.1 hypothetical protein FYJ91_12925 [Sphingomonas montanisoli]
MEHFTLRPANGELSYADRPANERQQFVLPAIPAGASSMMRELVDRYVTAWLSPVPKDEEGGLAAERWHEAARAIQIFEPSCDADNLAKLIVAIHYRDPEGEADSLEIDAPDAPEDRRAVEMELGCLDWFLARQQDAGSWDKALAEYRRSRQIYDRHASHSTLPDSQGFECLKAEADILLDFTTAKLDALIATPCPDLVAALAKLEICRQEYHVGSHAGEAMDQIEADFRRLAGQGTSATEEDPQLISAFETYRKALSEMKVSPGDLTDAAAAPFFERMDPADMLMKQTPARTVPGVVMKLKRAFSGLVEGRWADTAVFDERPAAFAKGLDMSGLDQQLLWGAIEDLERIAAGDSAKAGVPTWQSGLDAYQTARKLSDETPHGHLDDDVRVTAYCKAMDALFTIRAPDHAALLMKLGLFNERFEDGTDDPTDLAWIADDIRHLAAKGGA